MSLLQNRSRLIFCYGYITLRVLPPEESPKLQGILRFAQDDIRCTFIRHQPEASSS